MMDDMSERGDGHVPRRGRRARRSRPLALAGVLVLAACSNDSREPANATETTSAPTAAPTSSTTPTTDAATSTVAPTTTRAPSTSAPPTTTAAPATSTTTATTTTTTEPITITSGTIERQDTEPIAPPSDSYAAEPVVEVGTIAIPKLGVEMTMYEGIRMTTLDHGPGHWPGTAMPGQAGNVVVGGHRTSKHRVFRDVDQLAAGDEIIFSGDDGTHTYAVRSVEIVEPTAVWIVNPTETPTATLFACHPPGSTAQRIVVFADLVSA